MMYVRYGNISTITEENKFFRRVIDTTPNNQLVVMSLNPMEEIGTEIHSNVTQFIRIEKGNAIAVINDEPINLDEGSFINIPPGTKHNIINVSSNIPLKLYTIYSPPNHPPNRIDTIKPIND